MALAILRFQENDGANNRFQIELGDNRFYCYAIGSEIDRVNGIPQLRNVIYASPLMGPIPESSLGRTVLEIPNDKFDRQNRAVQLTSFRTNDRIGPAYSDVIQVAPASTNTADRSTHAWGMELDIEPGIGLGIEMEMDRQPTETVAFAYREVQEHPTPVTAEAMAAPGGFLSKIGSAVSGAVNGLKQVAGPTLTGALKTLPGKIAGVASQVMPLLDTVNTVAGLVGGGLPGPTPNSDPSAGGQPGAAGGTPDIMAMLLPLLQQMLGGALPATLPSPGVTPALMPPATPAPPSTMIPPGSATPAPQPVGAAVGQASPQLARRTLAPAGRPANAGRQVAQSMAVSRLPSTAFAFSDGMIGGTTDVSETMSHSEAMMLPTIAALLPVTLKATPSVMRMLGTQLGPMTDALLTPQRAAPRGMGMMFSDEEEPEETAVIALSLALATAATPDLVYKRIDAVKLAFTETNALMLHGRSRFLYRYDQDIAFPLKVETPKPIKKARLQLLVKHPKTLKILLEQNYRVENITAGTLDVAPQLNQEQLKTLAPNEEYLVCATLVWKAKSKQTGEQKRIGTSTLQLITLIREYIFDRVEGTSETIPLNDVDKFRPYWHKVWEDTFSKDVRRINLDCKYYYTLECDRTENARMETVTNLEESVTEKTGKLKAGLILSPYSLNELLGQISQKPSLGEAELAALFNSEFKDRFSHLAQTQVKFKGRKGEAVALWIYPELKLQQVLLKKADNINANGHVLALREYPVHFPMPAMAHFIGVST